MILYVALLVLAVVGGYLGQVNMSPKRKGIYLLSVGAVLIFFAACRSANIGADTPQFTSAYTQIAEKTWSDALAMQYEKGFIVLCKLLSLLSPSPQLLLAVTAVLSVGSVCAVIFFNSPDAVMSVALFIGLQYYANYMNLMRQVIAMSLVFLAFEFLLKRLSLGWIPFLLVVGLAYTFHTSALILAVSCLFWYVRPRAVLVGVLSVGALIGLICFQPLLQLLVWIVPRYEVYLGSKYMAHGGLATVLNLIICLGVFGLMVFAFLREKRFRSPLPETRDRLWNFFFWCAFAALVLTAYTLQAIIFDRLQFYFSACVVVTLPLAMTALPEKLQKFGRIAVSVGCLLFCVLVLALRPEWTKVIPYEFFFAAAPAA